MPMDYGERKEKKTAALNSVAGKIASRLSNASLTLMGYFKVERQCLKRCTYNTVEYAGKVNTEK